LKFKNKKNQHQELYYLNNSK